MDDLKQFINCLITAILGEPENLLLLGGGCGVIIFAMSITIKVPPLPYSFPQAQVGHCYKMLNEVVARRERVMELLVRDEIIPILAPQAGIVEKIFPSQGEFVAVGDVLLLLKTGLPNLVWDAEQDALILDTYRAQGVTTSDEYELRQQVRQGEAKFGKGFGSGLALPQIRAPQQERGMGVGFGASAGMGRQFKSHPSLAVSSQFSGDFKDPRVTTVPSNAEAEAAPQNAPTLGLRLQATPSAPTPKPGR